MATVLANGMPADPAGLAGGPGVYARDCASGPGTLSAQDRVLALRHVTANVPMTAEGPAACRCRAVAV